MIKCKTCFHWRISDGANAAENGFGKCRAHPSQLDPNYMENDSEAVTEDDLWWLQPIMHADAVCGEHKTKIAVKKRKK